MLTHKTSIGVVILCKTARIHTQPTKLSEHCGVLGELNGKDIIISKGVWPPISSILNPCDFYLWGNIKNVLYAKNPHDLETLKQNIPEAIYNI
jgi:hypothetical protein